jgi:hypothetical protein
VRWAAPDPQLQALEKFDRQAAASVTVASVVASLKLRKLGTGVLLVNSSVYQLAVDKD